MMAWSLAIWVEGMQYRSFTASDGARDLFHCDLTDGLGAGAARSDARRLNSKLLASSPWPSRAPASFARPFPETLPQPFRGGGAEPSEEIRQRRAFRSR